MTPLTERYKPGRPDLFAGLAKPKAVLSRFAQDPGPCAWLFLGPSGTGKTTMALALQSMIGGELHHIPSKECDLGTVQSVVEKCHYMPWSGKWHFVLVDEADQMSKAAQLAFLSKLDTTAAPPNTIFVFTANDTALLEDRFLSRVRTLEFEPPDTVSMAKFLQQVWNAETDDKAPAFVAMAAKARGNVRTALNALDMELMMANPRGTVAATPSVAVDEPDYIGDLKATLAALAA